MVAIVSGNTFGLTSNPLDPRGDANVGRSGDQSDRVYVNAGTGNLTIQNRDEYLTAVGPDLSLIRTYNSQGLLIDDKKDNWQLNTSSLTAIPPAATINASHSTITKRFGDGAAIVYLYQDSGLYQGSYLSTDGDGAHDTLRHNGTVWI